MLLKMLDGMEELTVQVNYLIPFISFRSKGCFKGFAVIKYTYVPCFKFTVLCLCLMWFDCFYGLLDNSVFRTFSNM